MKKLNIAMLGNQEPSSPEAINLDDNFEESINSVQDSLSDLNISMDDLEQIDETITQAVDASMELIQEQDAVEQAKEEGQCHQQALESIQRNVNNIVKNIGLNPNASFALEAYSNPYYNGVAMESALQTIKDFIIKIWEAIKKAFDKVKSLIKDIIKKYFDESLKVKKMANDLKKKADSLQGKIAPIDTKVGSYNLATYMRLNNQPLEADEMLSNFDKWTKYNHDLIEQIAGKNAIDDYKTLVKESVNVLKSAETHKNMSKLEAEADEIANKMLKHIYSALPNKIHTHSGEVFESSVILGDVVYSFRTKDLEFEIGKVNDYKELPTSKTHNLLGVMDVYHLCDKIDKHMDTYKRMDDYLKDLDNLKNEIDNLAKQTITSNKIEDYIPNKIITKIAGETIKLFVKAIGKVGIGARRHDMNVDKAVLEWCALSLMPL